MVTAQHSFSTALVPDYHTTSGKVSVLADDRSDSVADVDEELNYWVKQDQLLLGWIRATISREVLRHLVGLQTTFDVWQTLESRYASHSRSQILRLRTQLQSTKKGGLGINEYWLKMKIIADDLEAAGEFVHETDFAYYILGGLGPEFDPVSENLNSRLDSIGLTEVRSRLLAYESKLEDYNSALSMNLGHSHSANMISSVSHTDLNSVNLVQPPTHGHVETSGRNFQFSGSNSNVGRGFSPRARFDRGFVGNYNYRNENYNTRGRGFFGRGRGTNRPICQVCKMVGHTGDVCYYRYAQPFQQSVPQPSFTVGSANPRTFFAGVPHTLPHTLQSGFSNNFLYNYNLRSPVMPESTIGMVAPNLQSYGSMSGLSNPFSYGVSTPLGSSNNISGQVPQQSTGFCVHNGVPHFGAPLSASIGMNSAGYPFMPPISASIGSNVGHASVPQMSANMNRDKGPYFSNCATKSAAGVSGVVGESFCFPLACTTSSQCTTFLSEFTRCKSDSCRRINVSEFALFHNRLGHPNTKKDELSSSCSSSDAPLFVLHKNVSSTPLTDSTPDISSLPNNNLPSSFPQNTSFTESISSLANNSPLPNVSALVPPVNLSPHNCSPQSDTSTSVPNTSNSSSSLQSPIRLNTSSIVSQPVLSSSRTVLKPNTQSVHPMITRSKNVDERKYCREVLSSSVLEALWNIVQFWKHCGILFSS
ncbi:hypothetical protein FEM48_Zijuj09G0231400 [Ziziphus jujuba var. spinosa]|uniref:Uncharacterized protein n=1 Tax=Ziziphus jujuba var. spinosa TaxID=714518 RepID=A0A978UVV3_ZIZJJ|nr:hypothetical protein FEM48_Zijuj09G0231400 [Ziziphus jujuba var. spinosa]